MFVLQMVHCEQNPLSVFLSVCLPVCLSVRLYIGLLLRDFKYL